MTPVASTRRATLLSSNGRPVEFLRRNSQGEELDEHDHFLSNMVEFRKELLSQFAMQAPPVDGADANGDATPPSIHRSSRSALSIGEEPYLARFERPFPAHPIDGALLHGGGAGGSSLPFIRTGVPRVCVVLRGQQSLRPSALEALRRLAAEPAGLVVTVKPITLATEDRKGEEPEPLLFVGVGLAPLLQSDGTPRLNERVGRTADERHIIWAAVHEALRIAPEGERSLQLRAPATQLEDEELKEVVVEIFMLQEAWLYERLLHWLRKKRKNTWCPWAKRLFWQEELDLLVNECGEEIATHFLFVQSYTYHLRVAAVVAMGCWFMSHLFQGTFVGWTGKFGDLTPIAGLPWIMLVLFMPAWGFHFLATWRSVASHAGFRWNGSLSSVQNSVREVARLQSLESASQKRWRFLRVATLSMPLMGFQLLVVLSITAGFICIEVYIYDVLWETVSPIVRLLACFVYNLSFGIAFMLILTVFYPISKSVTNLEGHPDPLLVRYHRVAKLFANWFFAIFLYFFIIAFLYIPFGDNVAQFFAGFAPDNPEEDKKGTETVRAALEAFAPDIHRLFVDVTLFFVLQDGLRILHVLYPSIRALWSLGCSSREDSRPRGHKRTAIISGVRGLCQAAVTTPDDMSLAGGTSSRVSLLTEATDESVDADDVESTVVYCLLTGLTVNTADLPRRCASAPSGLTANPADSPQGERQTLRITCKLVTGAGDATDDAWAPDGPGVSSRLRTCAGGVCTETSGDLFTLVRDPAATGPIRLRVSVAILELGEREVGSMVIEVPPRLEERPPRKPRHLQQGSLQVGPVQVRYAAGVATTANHCVTLECVLGELTCHLPELGAGGQSAPSLMWWDEQLAAIHWDGVLELFAVHDTFETFELYGHLTTQFAYACLFTVVVPFIPGLAVLFTSLEARQDQLRILWLCRPPHPQPDEGNISLGAWYDILTYICHLSVIVNLLLWGLTYEGMGTKKASEWDPWEWWRNLAVLMLLEKGFTLVTWLFGNYVSMLDEGTAMQYLKREEALRQRLVVASGEKKRTGQSATLERSRTVPM